MAYLNGFVRNSLSNSRLRILLCSMKSRSNYLSGAQSLNNNESRAHRIMHLWLLGIDSENKTLMRETGSVFKPRYFADGYIVPVARALDVTRYGLIPLLSIMRVGKKSSEI